MDFPIEIFWKEFYFKNICERSFWQKYFGKGFIIGMNGTGLYCRNLLKYIAKGFIIETHWKVFYLRNSLKMTLLYECMGMGFTIRIYCKVFLYFRNVMEWSLKMFGKYFIVEIHWMGLYHWNALGGLWCMDLLDIVSLYKLAKVFFSGNILGMVLS